LPQAALIFSLTIALLAAWWRISEYSRFAAWYAKKRFVIKMTIRYPFLRLRQCERDGDLPQAALVFSLTHLANTALVKTADLLD